MLVLARVVQRFRLRPRICRVGLAVVFSLGWAPASALAAQVSGKVSNDFNTNGVFDTDPNSGAVDVGVGGLAVRAFTGADTLVGTATTAPDGTYSLNLPNVKVRLELDVVRPWWPSRQLTDGTRSDVQFVEASSAQTGVDFAVHRLSEYSLDNPIVYWPTQWAGPVDSTNPNFVQSAIRGAPYFSKKPAGQVPDWDTVAGHVGVATFGQVGTVFGLSVDQSTDDLYAGAYQKRLAGLKDGPGAIFKITPNKDVTEFTEVPDAGTDPHPTSDNINDWVSCANATVASHPGCDFSWTEVGKIGLGSVVIDTQDQNLYTVNLNDKKLYRFALNGSAEGRRGKRHAGAAAVQPADSAKIPNPTPGCVGGEWRPFSAAFDRVNERLYVGGVCSAETSQDRANLRAVVYRVDNPQSAAPNFVQVLDFPLDYNRLSNPANLVAPCGSPNLCAWQPWPTETSTGGKAPTSATQNGQPITENNNPSFPQLTAITFSEDGSMILGLRDLVGDMGGVNVEGEIGAGGSSGLGPMLHGDMLRAGPNPNGTFSIEQNGRVAGLTSAGQSTNPINWGYGSGMGPGGGYFYNPAPLVPSLHNYPFPYQGGLAHIPGFLQVVATSIHVKTAQANGLLWRSNDTTGTDDALQNFVTPDSNKFTGFAKSNGLGDIDAFTSLAPLQIGNRLWYDENGNGIQDADEPPVTDTIVELVDCNGNVIDTTRTDSEGEYVFSITPGTCYTVRVPLDQPSLNGWVPAETGAGDNPRIDSDGRDVDGRSVASVSPHGPGQNDHSYDFGFRKPPPPPTPTPPTPQPPAPQPAPPPQPPYAGAITRALVLTKHLLGGTSNSPSKLVFSMIVRNSGPTPEILLRVCDRLPKLLRYLSATKLGRTLSGQQVCWQVRALSSGQARTMQVTTRLRTAVLLGILANCATASGKRLPTHPHAHRIALRVQRACLRVRGRIRPPPPPRVTG